MLRLAITALSLFALPLSTVAPQGRPTDEAGRLYAQLVDTFHIQAVRVQFGELYPGHVVQVTFEDSTIFALSKPDRRKAARRVAEFIRDNFHGYKRLSVVLVSWSVKSPDGAMEMFALPFETVDLGQPRPSSKTQ